MLVVFRTDASLDTGTGHVMRCLTLADALRAQGAGCRFVCRELPGNLLGLISERGFGAYALPSASAGLGATVDAAETAETLDPLDAMTIDWLVVDHYGLGEAWECSMRRESGARLLVIDDLANRRHDCDLLLNQNYVEDLDARYHALIPAGAQLLLGPRYAMLRDEFVDAAERARRPAAGGKPRFFVFFGGTDPTGETAKALRALDRLDGAVHADVVVGAGNPQRTALAEWCDARDGLAFHCQIDNIAMLMGDADLALCAGGATTWERCFLGLPTLAVSVAENQIEVTRAVARAGAQVDLGWHVRVDESAFVSEIERLVAAPGLLVAMSAAGRGLMGGNEFRGTNGVVVAMMS